MVCRAIDPHVPRRFAPRKETLPLAFIFIFLDTQQKSLADDRVEADCLRWLLPVPFVDTAGVDGFRSPSDGEDYCRFRIIYPLSELQQKDDAGFLVPV
jgi:hypothetical protein